MLRLFKRKVSPSDLLSSQLFDETAFYQTFIRDLKRAKREVIIESPYMTTARVRSILPTLQKLIKKGVKVKVNTRFPEHHDRVLRVQAWIVTKELRNIGVKVRFFSDYHHRKIAVIDGYILWEGSLNILSQNRSREIMRRIESEQLTRQMVAFLKLKRFNW